MTQKMELEVKGMTCDHCVGSVRNAVQELPGVSSAVVDLDGASAVIEGENLDQESIIKAIEEEGYSASVRSQT